MPRLARMGGNSSGHLSRRRRHGLQPTARIAQRIDGPGTARDPRRTFTSRCSDGAEDVGRHRRGPRARPRHAGAHPRRAIAARLAPTFGRRTMRGVERSVAQASRATNAIVQHGRGARAVRAHARARVARERGSESRRRRGTLWNGTWGRRPVNTLTVEREFELTDAEFKRLRDLVHVRTGIALSDAKREMLYGRLARRLRKPNMTSFAKYCDLVERGGAEELQELTNAITTNLTSFFRENHHFEMLAGEAFPQIEAARSVTQRIRLWSAGCSTGEEPYSLAVVVREMLAHLPRWDIKLLATDIDSKVVATAAEGEYPEERFSGAPAERLKKWFPQVAARPGFKAASPELKSLITFKQLNLLDSWPMKGPFDIIFCRNVVIYFDKATQRTLFDRMAELQEPGGWLFVGHSESLLNVTRRYKLVGRTVYRRTD